MAPPILRPRRSNSVDSVRWNLYTTLSPLVPLGLGLSCSPLKADAGNISRSDKLFFGMRKTLGFLYYFFILFNGFKCKLWDFHPGPYFQNPFKTGPAFPWGENVAAWYPETGWNVIFWGAISPRQCTSSGSAAPATDSSDVSSYVGRDPKEKSNMFLYH